MSTHPITLVVTCEASLNPTTINQKVRDELNTSSNFNAARFEPIMVELKQTNNNLICSDGSGNQNCIDTELTFFNSIIPNSITNEATALIKEAIGDCVPGYTVNLTTNFNPHASSTNVEIGRGAINSATEFLTKIMEEYKEEIQKLGIPLQKIIGNLKSKL